MDKPSRNAAPVVQVTVTADDIARGIAGTARCCPVAYAAQRAFGDSELSVGAMCLYAEKRYYMPGPVQSWIIDFDAGGQVAPFSFWLGDEDVD